jgi:predicted ATPase with chaperone activity
MDSPANQGRQPMRTLGRAALNQAEPLETTKIHRIMGLLDPGQALITRHPFRGPHHIAGDAGLLGSKMPGEPHCSPREIQTYLNRVSGPLLDRIELHNEVPAVKFQDLTSRRNGEASASIREPG